MGSGDFRDRWEGRTLGRYEVVSYLGRGGMGDVLVARVRGEAGFEKQVVLKTLPEGFALDSSMGEALVREARLGERFEHSGIVQVLDFGREGDVHFLVMEYVRGFSLRALLRHARDGARPLPIWAAAHVLRETLGALAYVHEFVDVDGKRAGLVHRDVSPDNILLSLMGGVKLADFGVAKIRSAGNETAPGVLRGKYAYMAPESIARGIVDARFDLFSAGVVLYEMLALRRPFAGDDDASLIHAILEGRHTPLLEVVPEAGQELSMVVATALDPDPDARWQTARVFRSALDKACPPASDEDLRFADLLSAILTEPGFASLAALQATPSGGRAPLGAVISVGTSSGRSVGPEVRTVTVQSGRGAAHRPRGLAWIVVALLALLGGGVLWAAWPERQPGGGRAVADGGAVAPVDDPLPEAPLRWGTTAALGDTAARRNAEEVAAWLSRRLEREVRAHVAADYRALGTELADGRVDAAWLPPLAFVNVERRGVRALLVSERAGRPTYQSAIVVAQGSPRRSLDDLAGARAAWVDRESAAGYLFARALLSHGDRDPDRFLGEQSFAGSHRAVCEAVAGGAADVGATYGVRGDAGAIVQAPCADYGEAGAKVRVLEWSAPIPGDTIALRPGLDDPTTHRLAAAFVAMPTDPEARPLLTKIFRADGFVRADPSLYAAARRLLGAAGD